MDDKYVIYIFHHDLPQFSGTGFMEDKQVGYNELTRDEVEDWYKAIFPGRKPDFSTLRRVVVGPDYESMRLHDLQSKCKERGLSDVGPKEDLIARLRGGDATSHGGGGSSGASEAAKAIGSVRAGGGKRKSKRKKSRKYKSRKSRKSKKRRR